MPKDEADVERTTLMYALFAYMYHYEGLPVRTIAREIPFRIPLLDPHTRKPVSDVFIDGKIDKLVYAEGRLSVMEHKSTSDSVEPDSDYWGHLTLDTQTAIYTYAAQRLLVDGMLEPYKVKDDFIGGIVYDVWRKPQISPKKLSQADTAAFVAAGEYCGRSFDVVETPEFVSVDGARPEQELLKSGKWAIRETPEMFGCRLFSDIEGRPDHYFARRLLTRTQDDMEHLEHELFNLYQTIQAMTADNAWYHNEFSCDTYGRCDYCQFCFTRTELDPSRPPAGFKNIFEKGKT
jgi:hypothetical protein